MSTKPSLILSDLVFLYGEKEGPAASVQLDHLMDRYRSLLPPPSKQEWTLSEKDSLLICYADQVQSPTCSPLASLTQFCGAQLQEVVTTIHLLPFYPWSSDDGFAVCDYRRVDPALGSWADLAGLSTQFRLMFDAVINHISAQSAWFQGFLQGDPRYQDFFIVVEGEPDLSAVVRPRALPLLLRVATPAGEQAVWTTFSADQIDLNYRNPAVLLEVIETLLEYAQRGASLLRLDAIAFLWKEIGTPCIHLPQTHRIIQLIRRVLSELAPQVLLITETNVPHEDNVAYFGDGHNEAQLVYNFALPPLTLHALHHGQSARLASWARTLQLPSTEVAFFNFLASHDGIGLNPARGLLAEEEIAQLVERTLACGGLVSEKTNPDGTTSPYELNINYFDALCNPGADEPREIQVDRFLVAQAIMLSLAGLPGIYFHSLFGSRGWPAGVQQTGRQRSINREKLAQQVLTQELADPTTLRHQVFGRYRALLQARASSPAFHPQSPQQILDCGPAVFSLLRIARHGAERVLCLHNLSPHPQPVQGEAAEIIHSTCTSGSGPVLLVSTMSQGDARQSLAPYEVRWCRC